MAKGDNNYIRSLQNKNLELELQIAQANDRIQEMMMYFASSKFQGSDNDYAHVTTDIYPKLRELRDMTHVTGN